VAASVRKLSTDGGYQVDTLTRVYCYHINESTTSQELFQGQVAMHHTQVMYDLSTGSLSWSWRYHSLGMHRVDFPVQQKFYEYLIVLYKKDLRDYYQIVSRVGGYIECGRWNKT
jgi:hypothetical protein